MIRAIEAGCVDQRLDELSRPAPAGLQLFPNGRSGILRRPSQSWFPPEKAGYRDSIRKRKTHAIPNLRAGKGRDRNWAGAGARPCVPVFLRPQDGDTGGLNPVHRYSLADSPRNPLGSGKDKPTTRSRPAIDPAAEGGGQRAGPPVRRRE